MLMRFKASDHVPLVFTTPDSSPLTLDAKYCGLKRMNAAFTSQVIP